MTGQEHAPRAAILRELAEGPRKLDGLCHALWDEPGYWDEWPTVESVLKTLRDEGVVQKVGHYWRLARVTDQEHETRIAEARSLARELRGRAALVKSVPIPDYLVNEAADLLNALVAELEAAAERERLTVAELARVKAQAGELLMERDRELEAASERETRKDEALTECRVLFVMLRGDWSDNRANCRAGIEIIGAALAVEPADDTGERHDARAFRWHEGAYYAACECGWRTRTHFDEARAEDDARLHNDPTQRAEATTTPEGAKGWVDQAGSAQVLAGGHGLDVAPDASPGGSEPRPASEQDGGGKPSNAPNAAEGSAAREDKQP